MSHKKVVCVNSVNICEMVDVTQKGDVCEPSNNVQSTVETKNPEKVLRSLDGKRAVSFDLNPDALCFIPYYLANTTGDLSSSICSSQLGHCVDIERHKLTPIKVCSFNNEVIPN